jgi:hypothetical protein
VEQDAETPGSVLAAKVVAHGIGAGVGLLIGGPPGAVVGAMMTPPLEVILRRGDRRMWENMTRVLDEAADAADMAPDEIADLIDRDDRYLTLSAAAVQAAQTTLNDQKVAALARVLADGLRDDARLDVSWLIVQALADLESPHVRVLHLMATELCPPDDWARDGMVSRDLRPPKPGTWREKALQERLPQLGVGLLPVMATLDRHALVFGGALAAAADDRAWVLLDFGRECLRYLDGVAVLGGGAQEAGGPASG